MYRWDSERIGYMHDALRFTDYYRTIARLISRHLVPDAAVCDAGCGLGELGLSLLPYCRHVTCIDIAPDAIADLRSRASEAVTALCGDIEKLPPAVPYDAMVFCLFGNTEQTLHIARVQCRGKVFLVKRSYSYHGFSAGRIPLGDYNAENTARELTKAGIPYETEVFTVTFDQPLRSMEDARRFFGLYNRCDRPIAAEELEKRLCPGPTEEFPLCIPHTKNLQLFTLNAADIP